MYFSCNFTSLLQRKKAIFTQSSPLCESFDKFEVKYKFLALNNGATLTYCPLKNIFFTFYKRDSSIFKLLNRLDRISLMSYKKHLNDKLKKTKKTIKIALVFYFPQRSRYNCRGADVFLILLGCYSFYIIPPWFPVIE